MEIDKPLDPPKLEGTKNLGRVSGAHTYPNSKELKFIFQKAIEEQIPLNSETQQEIDPSGEFEFMFSRIEPTIVGSYVETPCFDFE